MQLFYRENSNTELSDQYDETSQKKLARKIEYIGLFIAGTALLVIAMILPSQIMENGVGIIATALALISAVYFLYTLILHILLKEDITVGEFEFAVKRFRICCGIYGGMIVFVFLLSSVVPIFLGGYTLADFITMGCQFTAVLCIGSLFFIEVNRPFESDDNE